MDRWVVLAAGASCRLLRAWLCRAMVLEIPLFAFMRVSLQTANCPL